MTDSQRKFLFVKLRQHKIEKEAFEANYGKISTFDKDYAITILEMLGDADTVQMLHHELGIAA